MPRRKVCSEAMKRRIAFGQQYRCALCHHLLPAAWHVDHVVPLHRGGSNNISNLAVLCPTCHCTKSQLEMIQWHEMQNERRERKSRYFDPSSTSCIH